MVTGGPKKEKKMGFKYCGIFYILKSITKISQCEHDIQFLFHLI